MTDADSAAQRAIAAADAAGRLVVAAEGAARRLAEEAAEERRVGMGEFLAEMRAVRSDVTLIRTDVNEIKKVVFVGNGQRSHAERITTMEASQGKVSYAVILSVLGSVVAFFKDGFPPR